MNSEESLAGAGLKFQVSKFDPCLYFVFGKDGESPLILATILGVANLTYYPRRLIFRDIASER